MIQQLQLLRVLDMFTYMYSLIKIQLDPEQIATKGFIAFSGSTRYIKQHTKSLPTLKHHKGSNFDVKETIVNAKMSLLELGV